MFLKKKIFQTKSVYVLMNFKGCSIKYDIGVSKRETKHGTNFIRVIKRFDLS